MAKKKKPKLTRNPEKLDASMNRPAGPHHNRTKREQQILRKRKHKGKIDSD